jgi:molecular chaperone GrpE
MTPEYDELKDDTESGDGAVEVWKQAIRRDFESWLATVEEIPVYDNAAEEEPDLYSFYEQLAIISAESRKSNRRAAEAFSQWGDVLIRLETELKRFHDGTAQAMKDDSGNGSLSGKHCLALIELLDRLLRLRDAFEMPMPKRRWFSKGDEWLKAWNAQREACEILITHYEALLAGEGIRHMHCLGCAFDPAMMTAAAIERDPARPSNTVIEELTRGCLRHGELLRFAQVKVNIQPQSPAERSDEGEIHE